MAQRGINKVILIGNAGKDPEMRYMPNGDAVTNLTIATSDVWKDKTTGKTHERTEWHRLVFFRKLAEIVGNHVQKGSKIYVEGWLQTRKWRTQDGQDRYTTEIVADQMQMLDSRSGNGQRQEAPAQDAHNAAKSNGYAPADESFDDDLPF